MKFGYGLNLSICNGCRKCAEACHLENNHDRPSHQSYIRVFEMSKGSMDFEKGNAHYDHPVPQPDKYYMPVQCQQCEHPPCVDVCPVEATWKEKDGIVVVDYNWCIGCRYCEAACPYHARRFNWQKPEIAAAEINPDQGYLSNRIRPQGVMEKCTFCLHRTRNGRLPACLEACPTGARVFGDLNDPGSEIRWVLENKLGGELLAIAAIIMCIMFVVCDLGRPDRFWHMVPGLGKFNFPVSMLTWDVIVLNGYLLINLHICIYLLYKRFRGQKPVAKMYVPAVFLSIIWAISIHTVTAFLYCGLGGRPFWNTALLAPPLPCQRLCQRTRLHHRRDPDHSPADRPAIR